MKRKATISAIVMLLCIIATVGLRLKSSTPLAMAYFGFHFASVAMVIVTITLIGKGRRGA